MSWGDIGGALIGGGASLIGADKQADAMKDAAAMNARAQKEFAQHGLRWKVADAKAAGLHPMAALGASSTSFAPSYVGDSPQGQALADFGQNLGNAIARTSTKSEQMFQQAMQTEQLKNAQLQNKLLEGQISSINSPSRPGGAAWPGSQHAIPGQGDSALIDTQPLQRTAHLPGQPHSEPGSITDVGWVNTASGGLAPVPSRDVKERIEDQIIQELSWSIRNQALPNVGHGPKPPKAALPKGATHWEWSVLGQEYRPVFGKKRNFGDTAYEFYEKYLKDKRFLSGRKYHK